MSICDITVIYSFRDKDPQRLIDSISSIRRHSANKDCHFLVIDYGSKDGQELESLSKNNAFEVLRTETEGLPWSRAKALNIGVKSIKSKIFITTDIDMIFDFDVLEEVLKVIKPGVKIHCLPQWLPSSGSKKHAKEGDKSSLGGLMSMYKEDFLKLGGFNEEITFWGSEDNEFDIYAINNGFQKVWIDKRFKMYHVWHAVSHGSCDSRPEALSWKHSKIKLLTHFNSSPRATINNIGVITTPNERPILKLIKNNQPFLTLDISKKRLIYMEETRFFLELKKHIEKGELFFIKTGPKFKLNICDQKLRSRLIVKIISYLNILLSQIGICIKFKTSRSQSLIFLMLENLVNNQIRDYYWDYNNGIFILPEKFINEKIA